MLTTAVGGVALAQRPSGPPAQAPRAPAPAGEPARPPSEAAECMRQGRQLFNNNDFKAALAQFKRAQALTGSWKVLIHIGVTQNRLHRYTEALGSLERYLKLGGDAIPPPRRARVARELAKIRALLARLQVVVRGATGGQITVDGRPVARAPLARPLLLGPGPRMVRVTLPGFRPDQQTVVLEPGKQHRVELELKRITGGIHVRTQPPGAALWLDGAAVGDAPRSLDLVPGPHRLRAMLTGRRPATEEVQVTAGQLREVMLALPARPSPPWYTRWYWWTAIGTAVTAAVVTGVVLGTRPHYDLELRLQETGP